MKRIDIVKFSAFSLFLLVVLFILSVLLGPVRVPLAEIFSDRYLDIIRLRFLRAILAILAGAGLSLSGVILQGIMRNPLAEPYVLGVSSGAGLGAVIALMFFPMLYAVNALAFLGGIVTIILVYNLAKINNKIYTENMVISGVLINALFSSILMFIISNSPSAKLHSAMWWLMGNLQIYKITPLLVSGAIIVIGITITLFFSKELNALSLGDEEALHLGVNADRVKKILLIVAALLASAIVSMCGIIGFIGLMIPHLTRKLIGPDNRKLLIGSALSGACFLLLCDIVSRCAMAPREIPIGVITSFVGVPFFIYILRKRRKAYFK